jgi:hypothetical protein
MALLNYTTKIDGWATVTEIQKILAKAGASHFSIRNEGGQPAAVAFSFDYNGMPLNFALPCNIEGIRLYFENLQGPEREKLVKSGFYSQIKKEPGTISNIGWRIIKDWVEAQAALISIGLATIEEVFMPYLVINASGETLANRMLKGDGMKLLNF